MMWSYDKVLTIPSFLILIFWVFPPSPIFIPWLSLMWLTIKKPPEKRVHGLIPLPPKFLFSYKKTPMFIFAIISCLWSFLVISTLAHVNQPVIVETQSEISEIYSVTAPFGRIEKVETLEGSGWMFIGIGELEIEAKSYSQEYVYLKYITNSGRLITRKYNIDEVQIHLGNELYFETRVNFKEIQPFGLYAVPYGVETLEIIHVPHVKHEIEFSTEYDWSETQ